MKVLIVGGEQSHKVAIEQSLLAIHDLDVSLSWATSVDESLGQLNNGQKPDVILLDRNLAQKNTARTLAQFNSGGVRLPIVIFSDKDNDDSALELIRYGASDLVNQNELNSPRLKQVIERSAERSFRETDLLSQMSEFAVHQMAEGVLCADNQDRILMWNPGMERIFGVDRQDALGRTLSDLLPFTRNDLKCIAEARIGRTSTGPVHSTFLRKRDGYGRFRIVYGPLRSSGNTVGLICFVQEIEVAPEQPKIETLEERLRLVSNVIPNLMWLSDQKGERTLFNDRWLEFTGRKLPDEKGKGWLSNIHRQDAQRFWKVYSQALIDRQNYHVEYRLKRLDGQFRMLLESGTPQFGPDGAFIGMIGSCNDISETRITQHRIERQPRVAANFTSTLDHAPIAIWKLDRNLVIQKANPAVAAQMRMTPEELVGRDFMSVVTSIPRSSFEAVLERGDRLQLENYPIIVESGEGSQKVFWDLTAWPLKDESDEVIGLCMSTSEVTERQQNMQQREDFVAALVHDLKTPLIGADRTLEQMVNGALGNLDAGQTEVLTMLRRSNHQLLTMVQNLIEVYRYEAGQPSLGFEEIDLFELIRVSVRELQALAEHRGIQLIEALPRTSALISADRLAIRRVFLNLFDNALKFTARGGSIRISSDEDDESYTVHVRDTGIGISEGDLVGLFQRFWQGETGKRYAPGTGLGLYLCKQIVTAHKGRISVTSQENQGTTFSVLLPLQCPPRD